MFSMTFFYFLMIGIFSIANTLVPGTLKSRLDALTYSVFTINL